jgi:hypothetical protein
MAIYTLFLYSSVSNLDKIVGVETIDEILKPWFLISSLHCDRSFHESEYADNCGLLGEEIKTEYKLYKISIMIIITTGINAQFSRRLNIDLNIYLHLKVDLEFDPTGTPISSQIK